MNGVAANTYTVTVTDANSCTAKISATVSQPSTININIIPVNGTCNAANGSASAIVSGGTLPYSYLWNTGSASPVISGLAAGTYTVTVTDLFGCTGISSAVVGNSGSPIITVTTITNVSCHNGNNGAIDITISGGQPLYTYSWSNGAITQDLAGLASGIFTVTVTDNNLCSSTKSITVTQPLAITFTNSNTNVSCFGGTNGAVDITVFGGTIPYSYLWSSGAITQDISGKIAGTYSVTVSDANSCTANASYTITQPTILALTLSTTQATCGSVNGSVTATPSGGTSPYTYLWNTSATTSTVNGLSPANYTVTVTDFNGCTISKSIQVTSANAPVISSALVTNVSCNGGSNGAIDISVTGGVGTLTYLWSNSSVSQDLTGLSIGTFTVSVTDANLCTTSANYTITQPAVINATAIITNLACNGVPTGVINITPSGGTGAYTYLWSNAATTQDISSVSAGTFSVTITDVLNCSVVKTYNVTQPLALSIASVVTNVSCHSANNGSINITVSGGVSSYTYQWSNGILIEDLSALASGTYTVTVTDQNGCKATASYPITQPATLAVSFTSINSSCGSNNGSINANASGGTTPYTYLWNNNATTQQITSQLAGTYTVTITDFNSCTVIGTKTISNQAAPVISAITTTPVLCFNGSTGSITITTSGGAFPLTYLWSNNATTKNINGVVANTYTVTVTDANNCTTTATDSVLQPSALSIVFSATQPTCGNANGNINAAANGGNPGYTYLWSTGTSGPSISNRSAGNYTVTATDVNGCTKSSVFSLINIPGPSISLASSQNVSCFLGSNGAINITVNSGTAPFSFLWSNTDTIEDISNLISGTYSVVVTDANSCTATRTVNISQPSIISGSFTTTQTFCGLALGSTQVNVSGGTPPYTYLWSNSATTAAINNLFAGQYRVTITDLRGCTKIKTVNVTQANGPVISIISQTDVSCNGGNNGAIDIDVSGGIQPYTYSWSTTAVTQDISNLISGNYTVSVTDNNGCSDSLSVFVDQPLKIAISSTITKAKCGQANGAVNIVASGGTSPYSYLWSNGGLSSSISNILAGNYTLTITDFNNCDSVFSFTVGTIAGPVLTLDSIKTPKCNASVNGAIYISKAGGQSPYQYLWNDGVITLNRINIAGGVYTITITDFFGCSSSLTVNLPAPTVVSAAFTVTNATCNLSNATVVVAGGGGTSPYTYKWNGGSISASLVNISAGSYTVTVTDSLGCKKTDSVQVVSSGFPTIQLSSSTAPLCFGTSDGVINVNVSGGTTPYNSLIWSNGDTGLTADSLIANTYTITVTDFVGCTTTANYAITNPALLFASLTSVPSNCGQPNGSISLSTGGGTSPFTYLWSNAATTSSISSLIPGIYVVTTTDFHNCKSIDSITVGNISAPSLVITNQQNVLCKNGNNGSIDISTSGGAGPYTYLWSNGFLTKDISGITAGSYTLTVTDFAGCTSSISTTITEPTAITTLSNVINSTCGNANGSIQLTPSGGTPGYFYAWSNSGTTATINGLTATTYSVTISDNNGCTFQQNFVVNNVDGPTVQLQSKADVNCPNGSDGSLIVVVQQGVAPYSYLWSNGVLTADNSNIPEGIYTVTVTDFNGCTVIYSDTVFAPVPFIISATISNATCGLNNGIIVVQVSGGNPSYSYLWSTSDASSTISSLAAGNYSLTLTDSRFCTKDTVFNLINTGLPIISLINIDSVSCNALADGAINLDVIGGVQPYTFTWINTTQVTEDVINLSTGNYSVIVTDNQGCTSTNSYFVGEPAAINVVFPLIQNATCGVNNGSVVVSVSGGIPSYSLLWSTGSINDTLFNIPAGSYSLTVTDFKGCTKSSIANVSNLSGPTITVIDSGNVSCPGGNNGFVTISISGGTLPLDYTWTNLPDKTPAIINLIANIYTVTVRDASGCIAVRSIEVKQPSPIVVNSVIPQKNPPFNLKCNQSSDGEIYLSLNGGTAPYNYIWSNGAITQNILGLSSNTYTVVITDQNNCTSTSSYILSEPPQLISNAGLDFTVCGETSTMLAANTPTYGIGYWTAITNSGITIFSDSTSAISNITNLNAGDNIFKWTVTDGKCLVSSNVTVAITSKIEAIPGIDRTICGSETNLNATRPQFGSGSWSTFSPGVSIEFASRAFTAISNLNFGNNIFQWTVLNGTCRDSAKINIYRRDSLDCLSNVLLPNAFSPNEDGFNDEFLVKGLEDYPDNEFVVYNRWGSKVYEKNSYRSNWKGTNNNGENLPDGTYFIILKVRQLNKIFKTYVDLRR